MLKRALLLVLKRLHKKQTKHGLKFKIGDCVSFKRHSLSGIVIDVRDIDPLWYVDERAHTYLVRWNTKWNMKQWDGKDWGIVQSSSWCEEESLEYTDPFRELIYQATQC